jgi:hypothetical protein
MRLHILALTGGVISIGLMLALLRRRQFKEKYAVLWLIVGVAMLVVAVWPPVVDDLADLLGVKSGANLLLWVGTLLLIVFSVHLSWEVSRLEDKTRALAEEAGLLRLEVEQQQMPRPADVGANPG